ncbi:glycoside hydrolase family 78 protein [Kushneria sp. AK178]
MSSDNIHVHELRAELLTRAIGIDHDRPRLSWKVMAPADWSPARHEIAITRDGSVETVFSVTDHHLVAWPDAPLAPGERAEVRVRAGEADGGWSPWSAPLAVERGIEHRDWPRQAVSVPWPEPDHDRQPPLFRRAFDVPQSIVRARLYITAHGMFEPSCNGQAVTRDAFLPGWSSYDQRLRYWTYDVTALLERGRNVLGVRMADGWYRGRLGFNGGAQDRYGRELSLLVRLDILTSDGQRHIIEPDSDWQVGTGGTLISSLYDGETFDARAEPRDWDRADFDAAGWQAACLVDFDVERLEAAQGPAVRAQQWLPPVRRERLAHDRLLLDMGQNMVGRGRITSSGAPGETVTLRHAEVLQGGELYTRPLRFAAATDHYCHEGSGREVWEPHFTYHGFRYVEVTASPRTLDDFEFEGIVYYSDMARSGWFACADPAINRLHDNVLWSLRGNFFDIPTDCPQRDERLGWTGDIQVFMATAAFLYDCAGVMRSWLRDLIADQLEDGTVPPYVPYIETTDTWTPMAPLAAWGDAAVIVPHALWWATGDRHFLEQQWASARAWVDLMDRRAGDNHLWQGDTQLGDWLDPSAPPDDPAAAMTDRELVASACFARCARVLSEMAEALEYRDEATHYSGLADAVGRAILEHYTDPATGRLHQESQTGYAMIIAWRLSDDDALLHRMGDRLAALVAEGDYRIATGFVGTPIISRALTDTGHFDTAMRQLQETHCPSWLYPVTQGATTIWERWDSLMPDGRVNPGEMTSFNHYALGAVAQWLHEQLAGLAPASPGYRDIHFAPQIPASLPWAAAEHESPHGRIAIRWTQQPDAVLYDLTVPTGCRAELTLPDGRRQSLAAGRHHLSFDRTSGALDTQPGVEEPTHS